MNQEQSKKYEVKKYGSPYKLGDIITENTLNKEELKELLESGVIQEFEEELLLG